MDLAAGEPADMSLLETNISSKGGNRLNQSRYDEFWKVCRKVLLLGSDIEERRQSEVLYDSKVHSNPNLVKQATIILQCRVVNWEL